MLLLLVFTFTFISASVEVNNYSVDNYYSPFENITGEINLTITGEDYDDLITSNDDDEISLGEFLEVSGNLFTCSPPDCSKDYSSSSGAVSKNFSVPSSGKIYAGFVLEGESVVVKNISFGIESDFGISSQGPLNINFFENEEWKFGEFSDEFLLKDWGCYDLTEGSVGPLIGDVLYCEMINVPDSGAMKVGALINGDDDINLEMTVYPESGTGASWACDYDPNSSEGCVVSPDIDDIFSAGNYQVCVSAESSTGYSIYDEDAGDTCGFVHSLGPSNSTKDYAIFAQGAKYADASLLASVDFGNEDIIDAANELIEERYGGDCSEGCILPIEISGVSQDISINDIELEFTENLELGSEDKIYNLAVIPVTVDFDGVLDLSSLGFSVSEDMKYIVSLGGKKLFSEFIGILPAPIITSVYPSYSPAGVPVEFFVYVNYSSNVSLTYEWDFGDNTTETTDSPYIMHTYPDLRNYTLTLEVSAGGNLTSVKDFNIQVISPEFAINVSLGLKRDALDNVISKLAEFPAWYGVPLSNLINIDFFDGELDRIGREQANAFSDEDFIDVAKDLYALNIPVKFGVEVFESLFLINDLDDVDIEPVEIISGSVTGASNEDYKRPIINWQSENVEANFTFSKFSLLTYNSDTDSIFSTYSFDVKLKENSESYFVINKPFNELYFKESVGARKAGNSTVIILSPESETSFEFYYTDSVPVTFFVSPKLSSIVLEEDVDETCNHNNVCEKERGENYNNCRNDCKPVWRAVVYLLLAIFFVFVLYSILQIWYKRYYEKYLFVDRRQMYNLLMYVTNARARGMSDDRIAAELRTQGWSSERVNYIIKKSIGKRTGLYEIIPFEKIFAFFRNRKATKVHAEGVATVPQQQIRRNINKSGFQRK